LETKHQAPKALKLSELKSHRRSEILEYTKRVITENGLSVTALNHFTTCPSEFLHKSILKVPEAPNATSEKGIAMHRALSNVWKESDRSPKNIEKIIVQTVGDYFTVSLLPLFEKEIIVEELVASAPKVAKALEEYFAKDGKVLTETWKESHFETMYKNTKIEFNLHGQLDALIESVGKVEVYDYKTREAMSENAIKGQTKDSDGNYFRQLIFYKILLQGNTHYKDKDILPALIFVKPDSKGRCPTISIPISKLDTDRVLAEVETLVQNVWSGEFLDMVCEDKDCKYCKNRKL
jgi:DNA helicase-2/ATP-dependent DNA helicase PcrA